MTVTSVWPSAAIDQGDVLTVTSPAAELAGPGCFAAAAASCAGVWPATFFALSATSARLASGTTPAATAVPPSETKSAATAMTSAGLGMRRPFMFPSFERFTMAPSSPGRLTAY